jgi:hypothetical protein
MLAKALALHCLTYLFGILAMSNTDPHAPLLAVSKVANWSKVRGF